MKKSTCVVVRAPACCVTDRSGLNDVEKIEQMQEPMLEALKHYVRSRRPEQPHIFAKMLMKLTELRSISIKGRCSMPSFLLVCVCVLVCVVGSLN